MIMSSINVSVPETSISSDGKYTLYHVSVTDGEKKYVLKKRYTDFANLKEELESLYSDSIPFQFPRKTFLRSTVKNSELTEERRAAFETFLKDAIVDKTNIKWRKSLPFREFLSLPPGTFSNYVNDSTKEHLNAAWSLSSSKKDDPITDLALWIDITRETKDILLDARSKVFTIPSETRKKLIIGRSKFEALGKGLALAEKQGLIGEGEVKRRGELLNSLKREHQDLEQLLSNVSQFPDEDNSKHSLAQVRTQLFKGRVIGEPQETHRTRGLDNQQLLQLQQNDFKDQDKELEQLGKIIQKQKELGIAINEELQLQNELLDELDTEVERTTGKLNYANKRVGKFT